MLLYRLLDYSLSPALSRYYTWKRNIFSALAAAHVTRFFSAHHSTDSFYYDAEETLNPDNISDSVVFVAAPHHEGGYFLSYLNSVGFNDLLGLVSENHFLCQHMY